MNKVNNSDKEIKQVQKVSIWHLISQKEQDIQVLIKRS